MKRVVVIGSGFAGAYAAKHLEKDFNVTLIDSKDYFEFTPSILRTIVEPFHMKKIQVLHNHYLRRAKIIMGCVHELREHEVILRNKKKIPFDFVIIASGSSYQLPIKEKEIVHATRAAHLRDYAEHLAESKKVVLIGGGLVGVELAAEIAEHYLEKEITIVHSRDTLIQRNHPKTIKYVTKFLGKHGVKIIFGERVNKRKGNVVFTDHGSKITTDMVILCTGIKANAEFMKKNFKKQLNERNQIKVNRYLQVLEYDHMFVAGDVTDRREEKTAQNAEKEASSVVHNLKDFVAQQPLTEYVSHKRPMVISLGKWHGVFEQNNVVFTGLLPGLLKSFIEWKSMRQYK
tara:strand:- start:19423 stop:20457 length:1035 start_codon:yes stop_codon:yes gene_type:complete